jgi:hypothetical protein
MTSIEFDKRAESAWKRAENAYQHYRAYMQDKSPKLVLSITDLVYVKNFKGGSTIIGEPPETIQKKLAPYEALLREADGMPAFQKPLGQLDDREYEAAKRVMTTFAALPRTSPINGFGVSFSTALLHFYFPEVVPILDRRGLSGAGIKADVDKQGQVKKLLDWYPDLIAYCRARLRTEPSLTLRALDQSLFIQKLRPEFRRRADDDD